MAKKRAATPSPMDFHSMIAEAAYYKAAARGFAPGQELADWLSAEAEIRADQAPAEPPARRRKPPARRKSTPAP